MPELPEVEVTRRSFASEITGAQILAAVPGKPLRWPLGCSPARLVGQRVQGVRRRGKYLLVDLSAGLLLVHLGMSGSLRFAPSLPPAGTHDHFDLVTSQGILRLNDPRRFGAVVFAESQDAAVAQKLLGGLGLEPLSDAFTFEALRAGLRASRAPIKQVLLGGKVVVGVGNIRPTVAAAAIGDVRMRRLHQAIRDVLALAVERGGSTLRNFSSAAGNPGHFQLAARVYGRAGAPCLACGSTIQSLKQGQRSSFFCLRCQRP